MNYVDFLRASNKRSRSMVCLGLDPVLKDIPVKAEGAGKTIEIFYEEMLNALVQHNVYPAAVKPNYAFYAQYEIEGIEALTRVCTLYRSQGIPVILDVKRGDIGKTASAYAREAYEFFKADAVTLSPFLGFDSIEPFIKDYPDKGSYILNKTSNKSSGELQDIAVGGEPLYVYLSKKIVAWHQPGIGAVVGATYPEELETIASIFSGSGKDIPLLIPGIGAQGGDLAAVVAILKRCSDPALCLINSSSALNYAYKQLPGIPYVEATVKALVDMNEEIDRYLEK